MPNDMGESPRWARMTNIDPTASALLPRKIDEVWDATFESLQKELHDSGLPLRAEKALLEHIKNAPEEERERLFQEGLREGIRRAFAFIEHLEEPIKRQLMQPIYDIAFQDGVAAGKKQADKDEWEAGYEEAKAEYASKFEQKRKNITRKAMRVGYRQGVLDTLADTEREGLKS